MTAKPNNCVTERLTCRYGLHRLGLRCGAVAYIALSSLILGLAYYPGNAVPIGIISVFSAIVGLPRIAGTPVLTIFHGLTGLLEMTERFVPMFSM